MRERNLAPRKKSQEPIATPSPLVAEIQPPAPALEVPESAAPVPAAAEPQLGPEGAAHEPRRGHHDLARAGVSAVARNVVGGTLSLNYMVGRIRAIQRSLGLVPVEAALVRGGDEGLLHLASEYGLSGYIRYHVHGPGTGREGYPIFFAPTRANQFANNNVEGFMRRQRDAGAAVEFGVTYATYSGEELRPFITGMLNSGDPKILGRLALDQGLIEKFLKSITYDIRVTPPGGTTSRYMANITVGPPGSGVLTTLPPQLVP